TNCDRCDRPCKVSPSRNPSARVGRRSALPQGLCPDCCVTQFLQGTEQLKTLLNLPHVGVKALLMPHIQQQFGALLKAGGADLDLSEINWPRVVEIWEKPFPKVKNP